MTKNKHQTNSRATGSGTTGLVFALFAIVIIAFAQPTASQTGSGETNSVGTNSAQTTGDSDGFEATKVDIVTVAKETIVLENGVPVNLEMILTEVPGATDELMRDVTVKAYGRYVDVEERRIGQIMLLGLEKDDQSESLDEQNFTTQFDLETPEFSTATPVIVRADQREILAILERLNAGAGEEVPEQTEEPIKGEENTVSESSGATTGNAEAAAYKNPEALEKTAEPVIASRTTTEGCSYRVDMEQEVAIKQTRVEMLEDGVVTDEGTCSDTPDRFPVERSYMLCRDQIEIEDMTVTAQYQPYFVDSALKRSDVGSCLADQEKQFEIVEEYATCQIQYDFENQTATPFAALIYRDDNNVRNEVRPCLPSEEKDAVALTATTGGCSIRHDFAKGKSYRQSVWNYTLDNVTYQASGCLDDGVEYTHQTAYRDSGNNPLCAPVVDFTSNQVTRQFRKYITVDGLDQFITECRPETSNSTLVRTTEGCSDPSTWRHDLAAGQSFEKERFYYMDGSVREYVTQCQDSEKTYTHQFETAGWELHDDKLHAFRLVNIYIQPDEQARHTIQTFVLQAGTAQTPYTLAGIAEVENGEVTYTGCDALRERDQVKSWTRPDGTTYDQYIGPATPVGPVFACTVTAAPYWTLVNAGVAREGGYYNLTCTFWRGGHSEGDWETTTAPRQSRIRSVGTYQGHRPVSREDGAVFTQVSTRNNSKTFYTRGAESCNYLRPYHPYGRVRLEAQAPETLYNQGDWDTAEGW